MRSPCYPASIPHFSLGKKGENQARISQMIKHHLQLPTPAPVGDASILRLDPMSLPCQTQQKINTWSSYKWSQLAKWRTIRGDLDYRVQLSSYGQRWNPRRGESGSARKSAGGAARPQALLPPFWGVGVSAGWKSGGRGEWATRISIEMDRDNEDELGQISLHEGPCDVQPGTASPSPLYQ
jgi:hypothetical protein